MTKIAFIYRPRRGKEAAQAFAGDVVVLLENVEYVIEFPEPRSSLEVGALVEVGYDPITDRTGVLAFKNFVGTAFLAGVKLRVISTKLGDSGVSGLLEEVSRLSSSLVFGWRSPSGFSAAASGEQQPSVPFHQLQLLRDVIIRREPGQRLQDFFAIVERSPTRRFLLERPVVPIERARNFDSRSVTDIFTHPERLVAVRRFDAVSGSPLAQALGIGEPPVEHYPTRVSISSRRLSYDTPENRFIKHFIGECLVIVYRFLDESNIHAQMRADCRVMASILEAAVRSPFLSEVGVLTAFAGPTQALGKGDGYKDILDLWLQLGVHQALPGAEGEVERFIQGKDIALLYEYWVFLKVLQAVCAATGSSSREVAVSRNDLGEGFARSLTVSLSDGVSVAFNPSYTRSAGSAYSTPLRPDVVVILNGARYAFDAKYRLEWLPSLEDSQDEDATFVRADLYKMHTYRDAISDLKAAFIVYPGSEFMFYERGGGRRQSPGGIAVFDGVGAIPARPEGADSSTLMDLVQVLVDQG
ncbi:DUF2357 domain-containing protein [Pseudomonas aeruginosa]|uniref:DUF2357 domain-containing protein n=1 Tax=Pseudomonas aeruginosa TaxID=287 RepID=UPI0029C0BE9C|nr:DUF2357 domain-containing protein [Pseudomonas aeruginosa]HBP1864516.1 DUF2357 domain-containing protein [Pseudomonas aeruginosa]